MGWCHFSVVLTVSVEIDCAWSETGKGEDKGEVVTWDGDTEGA